MPYLLKNSQIEMLIDLPDDHYQGARFDWSGKIKRLTYRGVEISGKELANQATNQQSGQGFYNEFGIQTPIGYADVQEGEYFHKIGIGLLKKEGIDYDFQKDYEIKPAQFKLDQSNNSLRIKCQSQAFNGYSYLLKKEVSLHEQAFNIAYHLTNTGDRSLITEEYNHNFLCFNQELISQDYVLKFPFKLQAHAFGETVNPERLVRIGTSEVNFIGTPQKPFFFSNLSGGNKVVAQWALENRKIGLGIEETGSFQTDQVNLWGWTHVISPELFFPINLPPKQTLEWNRTYRLYSIP